MSAFTVNFNNLSYNYDSACLNYDFISHNDIICLACHYYDFFHNFEIKDIKGFL